MDIESLDTNPTWRHNKPRREVIAKRLNHFIVLDNLLAYFVRI
jgi:hypothetical protein